MWALWSGNLEKRPSAPYSWNILQEELKLSSLITLGHFKHILKKMENPQNKRTLALRLCLTTFLEVVTVFYDLCVTDVICVSQVSLLNETTCFNEIICLTEWCELDDQRCQQISPNWHLRSSEARLNTSGFYCVLWLVPWHFLQGPFTSCFH